MRSFFAIVATTLCEDKPNRAHSFFPGSRAVILRYTNRAITYSPSMQCLYFSIRFPTRWVPCLIETNHVFHAHVCVR